MESDVSTHSMYCQPPFTEIVVSADSNGKIQFWNEKQLTAFREINTLPVLINQLALSPDGLLLAAARKDSTVALWKVHDIEKDEKNIPCAILHGHTGTTTSVAFSPDGKRLISSGLDRTIKFWDTETNEEVLSINKVGREGNTSKIAFSPDGSTIARTEQNLIQSWTIKK